MALTKTGIVQIVSQETGLSKNRTRHAVETLMEIIKNTLTSGEDVLVTGFGKFCVRAKFQRCGRNPATGEPMVLAPRRVVTFKCAGKLRDRCNSGECEIGD